MRDTILLIVGTLAVLVFTGFMFDYYLNIEKTQVIKQNVYYDSLLLEEQKQLKLKDSIIGIDAKTLKRVLNNHEHRLNKLEKSFENSEKD